MAGPVEGYRLIDMELLQCLVSSLACTECHEKTVVLEEDVCKKKGLAYFITVLCTECDYEFGLTVKNCSTISRRFKRYAAFRSEHSYCLCFS